MSVDDPTRSFSLKRWSRQKLEAARAVSMPAPDPKPAPAIVPASTPLADTRASDPVPPIADAPSLPPVDSLTFDSDFSAFLKPKVEEQLKRQALKQLFRSPHFNVMDGLDVYIADYSTPDPLSPDIVRQMVQSRYIFDPPKMRVNEHGVAEDVPEGEVEAPAAAAAEPDALPQPAPAAPTVTPSDAVAQVAAELGPAEATPHKGPESAPR